MREAAADTMSSRDCWRRRAEALARAEREGEAGREEEECVKWEGGARD